MNNRLVRRFFRCNKCKEFEAQLVHPNKFDIKCTHCGTYLNEIQEKEFKKLKKARNQNNNEHKSNNDEPIRPSEDLFRNISSVYNRPPSNLNNRQNNNNNNNSNNNNSNNNNRNRFINFNNNNTNHSQNQQRNRRYQSTSHYTDMNIVNDNNRYNNNNINTSNSNTFQNNNNINNPNYNNFFRSSNIDSSQNQNRININAQNENTGERRQYGQGARNRERSQDPPNLSFLNNFFNNMFGFIPIMNTPIIISSNGQPYRIIVQRQNVPQNLFDPAFLAFGAMFDNNFRDNYSSNFRSNFRGDFLSEIIRILERNQEEAARRRHPPTSEAALKKLKRFPLTDKYCKKDKKGKIELPNCCICISDIEKNEETVLLPCGHMFHWNCCLNWLKGNNTCPMCRFEIKE